MAVTTEKSTQLTAIDAGKRNYSSDYGGVDKTFDFDFTQSAAAGDATSTAELVRIPAGRWYVHLDRCYAAWSAFGTARTLDIGWAAYTAPDGTAVVADPNGFDDAIDVAAAGGAAMGSDASTTCPGKKKLFNSRDGVSIIATVAGGTIPAAATLIGKVGATSA